MTFGGTLFDMKPVSTNKHAKSMRHSILDPAMEFPSNPEAEEATTTEVSES